jgi:CRISPR system Cascade subunit CasE
MLISRITLSPHAQARDLVSIAAADVYADHRLIWSFFGRDEPRRTFLYRRMEGKSRLSFLVVSEREPVAPSRAWIVETKDYDPGLEVGRTLRFVLRANPVIRRRTDGGKQRRDDVVMDAKRRFRVANPNRPVSLPELVQEAGVGWLLARASRLGFQCDAAAVQCDGYRQHRIVRRGVTVSFSSVDLEGILTVTDSELFCKTLFAGIGPSKAFGCGLLLVRKL